MNKRAPSQRQIDARLLPYAVGRFRFEQLLRCEEDYRSGNRRALAIAIQICAEGAMLLPDWVRTAWATAYTAISEATAGSWDDFLGGNRPSPKKLAKAKRDSASAARMVAWIDANPNVERIDSALFERLAEDIKLGSAAAAKRVYYALPKGCQYVPKARIPVRVAHKK